VSTNEGLLVAFTGIGVLLAALFFIGSARAHGLRRASRLGPLGALGFCALLGVGGYSLPNGEEETLFEVVAEGSPGARAGDPAPVREFDVLVEHPGVEHTMTVDLPRESPGGSFHSGELHVRLDDPAGRPLAEQYGHLGVDCHSRGCDRDSLGLVFTPATAGPHRLVLTVLTPDVPLVHVHIGDPEKTDGVRAPGY
jgi:hypothetical protein